MRYAKLQTSAVLLVLACLMGPAYAVDPAIISGQVTEAGTGTPISGATVVVSVSQTLNWVGQTNADGEFEVEVLFSPGQPSLQVVIEAGGPDHLPQRFGGTPDSPVCFFGCPGDGWITVSSGGLLEDKNLALLPGGGRFSGSVISANTGQPLDGIEVVPILSTGDGAIQFLNAPFYGITSADGSYTVPLAMPPGSHHALARVALAPENHVATAFGNVACQFGRCAIAATETFELDEGELLQSIDFSMRRAAFVSGELLPADAPRLVSVYDGAGSVVTTVFVPPGTPGWATGGLAGGSYYIELRSLDVNLQRQLHNGSPCPLFGCERATGSPLEVPLGASVDGVNVTLQPAGSLRGTIVDADTGQPPAASGEGVVGYFNLINADGSVAGGGTVQAQAGEVRFATTGGVVPGQYFLRTYDAFYGVGLGDPSHVAGAAEHLPGYTDAVFPDVACAGLQCDLDQAQTVTIVAGEETEVIVALSRGSMISGSVLDDADGSGIGPAVVELVDAQNRRLATAVTDSDGAFSFGAFPAGSYYLRTAMSSGRSSNFQPLEHAYFDRVLGKDELCSEQLCDPGAGTAVVVDGVGDAGPFELRVEPGPVIGGRIFDQTSGQLITRGRVEIRTSDDRLVGMYKIRFTDGRFQSTALPPDTYTLIPRVSPAFIPVTPPPEGPDGAAAAGRQGSPGVQVTLGTQSVDTELQVVDLGADRVFRSGFISLPFGQ